ncbi:MAG TPA: hypothetical protein VJJ52_03290 [Candidatus Nanoarchaeia archaeon]|nr:hypothetical protein [Candidatus Nanoarchaeia archaeon]
MITLQDRLQPVEIKASDLLLEYGPCPAYRTESGRIITLLPTRSVPETHLIEENWNPFCARVESGNFRRVRWIYKLANGEKSSIYVKGPEHILGSTGVWWGGKRSGERAVYVNDLVVDEQVEWEAIFLLRLLKYDIRAEIPQAIVETNGEKELITKQVNSDPYWHMNNPWKAAGPNYTITELIAHIKRETGLVPCDLDTHNTQRDDNGYLTIIDVNRWKWPPHTDDFARRLKVAISYAVKNAKR